MYTYDALILSAYDGDTITANVDLGFYLTIKVKGRLAGIDTPEIRGKSEREKALAIQARDFLREKVLNKTVRIFSAEKPDKYGRAIVEIWELEDGEPASESVNQQLIKEGLARPYSGGKREPW